ncbi:hypothetical protein L5515_002364 [Caenorhabditis briggsae]|uniref:Uncharacterized protein n=1 Tax=Caenorhabditis briggsae TaxID=6238 RepID=A0AAE9J598_CAEBR|nr:hypothetical protein L5515_002364 [Caenorhabditis briggsae]
MSNYFCNYGFLCDFDSRNIYLFDCVRRRLKTILNTYNPRELVLGQSYQATHACIKEREVEHLFRRNVKFYTVNDLELYVDTIATMPENLPGLEKFQGKIWSQYLGFLRDTKNKFAETMCGDELGWVTVKYAPDGDTVFEITHVVPNCTVHLDKEELLPKPWSPEYSESVAPQHHPSEFIVHNKHRALNGRERFAKHSVCIETNILNPVYDQNHVGSSEICHHLFTTNLGMIRSVQPVELGKWYQHEVIDNRHIKARRRRDKGLYLTVSATKLFEIDAPIPTKFQLEFPFDHDVLESLENRSTIGWYQRTKGLKKDAHFLSHYLGKVEIYPRHTKEIIQKVEAYRRDLPEPFKSEPITVVGEVVRHRNSYENNKTYPEFGIFLVKNVVSIKDVTGKIINF